MTAPKYPHIEVQLSGEDGNGFFIIGRVSKAMRQERVDPEEIKAFQREAMSGDYSHLLATVAATVSVA